MAKVTFIGGEHVGNIGQLTWPVGPPGHQTDLIFPLNKAVDVTDAHVLKKIRGMGPMSPFKIEDDHDAAKAIHGHGASASAGDDDEAESAGTLRARQRKIT